MTQSLGTILLVCTSHSDLAETGHKTGFWMEELAAPYYAFKEAGFEVAIASPQDGLPPVDPGSLAEATRLPVVDRFEADQDAMRLLSASSTLQDIAGMEGYAGIFLVGGHGTMWDFPDNPEISRLLIEAAKLDKVIGAVCHGVAGLLAEGEPGALAGKAVTGFSNDEEAAVGLTGVVPFLLESCLQDAGYAYQSGAVFAPNVVTDGRLITGQNPTSSQATAEAMLSIFSSAVSVV